MSSEALRQEYRTLTRAHRAYRVRLDAAYEAFEAAKEFSLPVENGRYTVDLDGDLRFYPAVAEAKRQYEALRDDDGFFWLESRIFDLEGLLGLRGNRQLPFEFATMAMPLHPEAAEFVRRLL